MKKKTVIVGFILVLLVLASSGCLDSNKKKDGVTYIGSPVKISYTISYGYDITCSGTGNYILSYDCDIPEVLDCTDGTVTNIIELNDLYKNVTRVNNPMKTWNVSGSGNNQYEFGLTADVEAEGYVVYDLDGAGALTLQEITEEHPDIYEQYTKAQYNETNVAFIDPGNFYISAIAQSQITKANTYNSFLVAKQIFIWLKEKTYYKTHDRDDIVQTACETREIGSGDCDDLSFLYISLCRSAGIPARFIRGFIVYENLAIPHAWAEVFVGKQIGDNNGWIPVECACNSTDMSIQINQNFAIETADHLRLFTDQGTNESLIVSFSGIKAKYEKNKTNIAIKPIIEISSYSESKKELTIDKDNNRYYS